MGDDDDVDAKGLDDALLGKEGFQPARKQADVNGLRVVDGGEAIFASRACNVNGG